MKKPVLELTWFQIGCAAAAWALILFVLALALAGCSGDEGPSLRVTAAAPACVFLCFIEITDAEHNYPAKEELP